MSKKLSAREVIALVSQTDIEPTDALVSEIRKEYKRNPDAFQKNSALWKGVGLMKTKVLIIAGAVCAVAVLCVILNKFRVTPTAHAAEYSMERFDPNTRADVSDEFIVNQYRSQQMMDNFWQRLTKTPKASDEYTIDGVRAEDYPDYYAGNYINVDGKLIVMIKETYFEKNYRNCDWYKELAKVFKSEDFACKSARYNYTEIINGCTDLVYGQLGKAIKEAGVEWVAFGSGDYGNRIVIEVRTAEDASIVESIASSDLFSTVVVGDAVPVLD